MNSLLHLNDLTSLSFKGLLFVGDPHVWSHKPGRRRDNYLNTICNKLEQIVEICNRRQLVPVILGDLFHHAQDNDLMMISRMTRIFSQFHCTPIVLVGNHDLTETELTEGTTLDVFHSSGQILTIIQNGPFACVDLQTDGGVHRVVLGGTPYGQTVPTSLVGWYKTTNDHDSIKKKAKADTVVWITHDDFAFDNSYPNALPLKPILGVDLAVNGHMHRTQKPVRAGETSWHNPGNISRISVDLIDQEVAVWAWEPHLGHTQASNDLPVMALEKILLKHEKGTDIMSLEGRNAKHAEATTEKATTTSRFVEELKKEQHVVEKTDEGVYLRETLDAEFELMETPKHIRHIVDQLFQEALEQHRRKSE